MRRLIGMSALQVAQLRRSRPTIICARTTQCAGTHNGARCANSPEDNRTKVTWQEAKICDERTVSAYDGDQLLGDIEHWPDEEYKWELNLFDNELDRRDFKLLKHAKQAIINYYKTH